MQKNAKIDLNFFSAKFFKMETCAKVKIFMPNKRWDQKHFSQYNVKLLRIFKAFKIYAEYNC